jgi:hypothetical protein
MAGPIQARRRALLALALFFSSLFCPGCARKSQSSLSWEGSYQEIAADGSLGPSTLLMGRAVKGSVTFILVMARENGMREEIKGSARVKGTSALYSRGAAALSFSLDDADGSRTIALSEADTRYLSDLGFPGSASFSIPREVPGGTPESAVAFEFGYYIPAGSLSDSLPESLSILRFDEKTMTVTESSLFEGMIGPERELGSFSLVHGAPLVSLKAGKGKQAGTVPWSLEGKILLRGDTGERYVFWKSSLDAAHP